MPGRARKAPATASSGAGCSKDAGCSDASLPLSEVRAPPHPRFTLSAFHHPPCVVQLPLELCDRIFATLELLDLGRLVATCRFCHSRLEAAITTCSLRLRLGGYAAAVGLRSARKLIEHLDTALPRLPRAIVVTWLGDFDWRVRLGALRSLSLRGGGNSTGDSAGISAQHGAAIAALQEDPHPEVRTLARSLLLRIAPQLVEGHSPAGPAAPPAEPPAPPAEET